MLAKNSKKNNINKAFRILRKNGYIAKQNFSCCQSCGRYELNKLYGEEKCKKLVFYNIQDTDLFKKTGELYLSWNGNGEEICNIFIECGLNVTLNRCDSGKIIVK